MTRMKFFISFLNNITKKLRMTEDSRLRMTVK